MDIKNVATSQKKDANSILSSKNNKTATQM